MLEGYKTYILAVALGIFGIMKAAGLVMEEQAFVGMVEAMFAIAIFITRKVAKPKA